MSFVSYAQNFEDVILMRTFSDVEQGLYIDVGAQDPTVDSVSRAFHERGWRGVHVEPSAHYADMLRRERPQDTVIQAAITEQPGIVTFFDIPGTGISTIDRAIAEGHRSRGHEIVERQVAALPLSVVLGQCAGQTVQWLKLDVEGAEEAALRSWGDAALRPLVVVVESTLPMTQTLSHDSWEPMLLAKGYQFAYFDGLNRYYLSSTAAGLLARLALPPNIFDDFELNGTASAPFHRGLLRRQVAADAGHAEQVAALRTEIGAVRADALGQQALRDEAHRQALDHVAARAAQREQAHAAEAERADDLYRRTANHLDQAQRELQSQRSAWNEEAATLRADLTRSLAQGSRLEAELARSEERYRAAQGQISAAEARLAALARDHQQQLSRQAAQHAELLRTMSIEHTQEAGRADAQWRQRWLELRQDHERALAQATAHHAKLLESAQVQSRLQTEAAKLAAARQAEAYEQSRRQAEAHFDAALAGQAEAAQQHGQLQEARLADLAQRLAASEAAARQSAALARADLQDVRQLHEDALATLERERAQLADAAERLRGQLQAALQGAEADLKAAADHRMALAQQLHAVHRSWAWKSSAVLRWLRGQGDPMASATALAMGGPASRMLRHLVAAPPRPAEEPAAPGTPPDQEGFHMHRDLDLPVTIDELLAHHDEEFVNHAYRLLLGRAADPSGFMAYLNLVRAGAAKEGLVLALVQSDEGRRHAAQVPGLAELAANGREATPGRVTRLLGRLMGAALAPAATQLRAIQNQLYRSDRTSHQSQEHLRTVARALQGLQGRLRELEQRLPMAGTAALAAPPAVAHAAAPASGAGLAGSLARHDDFSQQLATMAAGGVDTATASARRAEVARALAEAQATLGAGGRAVFGRWVAAQATQDSHA